VAHAAEAVAAESAAAATAHVVARSSAAEWPVAQQSTWSTRRERGAEREREDAKQRA
jgi:hypothetical protein